MPQYVDAPKPRDFNSEENAIVSFNLGQFVKVYDVYGWPDLTGEGVTDAYQVLEMRDDWALNPETSVSGRQIGRCRTIQIQEDQTGIYDLYMFDIQMYTAINLAAGNQSVQVGDVIVGRTSNARGFVADAGSGNYFSLEQVSGRFVNGEVMERDGRVIGTLEAAWTFEAPTDTRSCVGRNGSNQVIFGCNWLLNDQKEIEATTVTLDQAFTLTGFRTKFENDLRPGEVVTVSGTSAEGETSFRVERVDPQYIKTQSGNSHTGYFTYNVFDYATQVAELILL